MRTHYLGIDPGGKGSICLLSPTGDIVFVDYSKTELRGYIDLLKKYSTECVAAVEAVHSMPQQGVKSMFSFGQRLGELEGVLQALDIPYTLVRPQTWMKELGVPPKTDKKGIASRIQKLYPLANLVGARGGLLDGRSDALCLAHYLKIKYPKGL